MKKEIVLGFWVRLGVSTLFGFKCILESFLIFVLFIFILIFFGHPNNIYRDIFYGVHTINYFRILPAVIGFEFTRRSYYKIYGSRVYAIILGTIIGYILSYCFSDRQGRYFMWYITEESYLILLYISLIIVSGLTHGFVNDYIKTKRKYKKEEIKAD